MKDALAALSAGGVKVGVAESGVSVGVGVVAGVVGVADALCDVSSAGADRE